MKNPFYKLRVWFTGSANETAVADDVVSQRDYIERELNALQVDSPNYAETREVYCLMNSALYNSKSKDLSACKKCADLDNCVVVRNR